MSETTTKYLTYDWLRKEDSYQHQQEHSEDGKFSFEENTRTLAEGGVCSGFWEYQLYQNYVNKLRMGEAAEDWPRVLQAAGKLAATARALYVVINTLRSPIDVWEAMNRESLEIVRNASIDGDHFNYGNTQGIEDTPFDDALHRLDDSLPKPFATAQIPAVAEDHAHTAMMQGYYYFYDKTEKVLDLTGKYLLPKAGVPSGELILETTHFKYSK